MFPGGEDSLRDVSRTSGHTIVEPGLPIMAQSPSFVEVEEVPRPLQSVEAVRQAALELQSRPLRIRIVGTLHYENWSPPTTDYPSSSFPGVPDLSSVFDVPAAGDITTSVEIDLSEFEVRRPLDLPMTEFKINGRTIMLPDLGAMERGGTLGYETTVFEEEHRALQNEEAAERTPTTEDLRPPSNSAAAEIETNPETPRGVRAQASEPAESPSLVRALRGSRGPLAANFFTNAAVMAAGPLLAEGYEYLMEEQWGRQDIHWSERSVVSALPVGAVILWSLRRGATISSTVAGFASILPIDWGFSYGLHLLGMNPNTSGGLALRIGWVSAFAMAARFAAVPAINIGGTALTGAAGTIASGLVYGGVVALSFLGGVILGHYVLDPLTGWGLNGIIDAFRDDDCESNWQANDSTFSDIIAAGLRSVTGASVEDAITRAAPRSPETPGDRHRGIIVAKRTTEGEIIFLDLEDGPVDIIPDPNSFGRRVDRAMISVGVFFGI